MYLFVWIASSCYAQQKDEQYWIGKEIKNESGFLLEKGHFDHDFGIAFGNTEKEVFVLFFKIEHQKNTIIDIVKFSKTELQRNKLTEYCQTKNGADTEIIALVKNTDGEFYTNIKKAWRANRTTGKFEKVNRRTIVKCGNENDGI